MHEGVRIHIGRVEGGVGVGRRGREEEGGGGGGRGRRGLQNFIVPRPSHLTSHAALLLAAVPQGVTYCGDSGASSLTMSNVPYHEEVCPWVRPAVCVLPNATHISHASELKLCIFLS